MQGPPTASPAARQGARDDVVVSRAPSRARRRGVVTVATAGIAVVALVAAGVVAGAVLLGPGLPSSVAGPEGPAVAPVAVETYDGVRRVQATPRLAEPVPDRVSLDHDDLTCP